MKRHNVCKKVKTILLTMKRKQQQDADEQRPAKRIKYTNIFQAIGTDMIQEICTFLQTKHLNNLLQSCKFLFAHFAQPTCWAFTKNYFVHEFAWPNALFSHAMQNYILSIRVQNVQYLLQHGGAQVQRIIIDTSMTEQELQQVCLACPNLIELRAHFLIDPFPILQQLQLQVLHVWSMEHMSSETMLAYFQAQPQIRELKLNFGLDMSFAALFNDAKVFCNLESLTCDYFGIPYQQQSYWKVKKLHIVENYTYKLQMSEIMQLFPNVTQLDCPIHTSVNASKLTRLNAVSMGVSQPLAQIDAPQLEKLTAPLLFHMVNDTYHHLTTMQLSHVLSLNELNDALSRVPRLVNLYLTDVSFFTTEWKVNIPLLKRFHVHSMTSTVSLVIKGASEMESIRISNASMLISIRFDPIVTNVACLLINECNKLTSIEPRALYHSTSTFSYRGKHNSFYASTLFQRNVNAVLTRLKIEGTDGSSFNEYEVMLLSAFLKRSQHLKYFDFVRPNISKHTSLLEVKSDSLEHLRLEWQHANAELQIYCTKLKAFHADIAVNMLALDAPKLDVIKLSGSLVIKSINTSPVKMHVNGPDAMILNMINNMGFSRMEKIIIKARGMAPTIDDAAFSTLVGKLIKIRVLKIDGKTQIRTPVIKKKTLQILEFSSSSALLSFSLQCQNLYSLSLLHCANVTGFTRSSTNHVPSLLYLRCDKTNITQSFFQQLHDMGVASKLKLVSLSKSNHINAFIKANADVFPKLLYASKVEWTFPKERAKKKKQNSLLDLFK